MAAGAPASASRRARSEGLARQWGGGRAAAAVAVLMRETLQATLNDRQDVTPGGLDDMLARLP